MAGGIWHAWKSSVNRIINSRLKRAGLLRKSGTTCFILSTPQQNMLHYIVYIHSIGVVAHPNSTGWQSKIKHTFCGEISAVAPSRRRLLFAKIAGVLCNVYYVNMNSNWITKINCQALHGGGGGLSRLECQFCSSSDKPQQRTGNKILIFA